jgi:hypothetical protein
MRLHDDPLSVSFVQRLGVVGVAVGWLPVRHLQPYRESATTTPNHLLRHTVVME